MEIQDRQQQNIATTNYAKEKVPFHLMKQRIIYTPSFRPVHLYSLKILLLFSICYLTWAFL